MTLLGKPLYPALKNGRRRGRLGVVVLLAMLNVGCQSGNNVNSAAKPADTVNPKAGYEIVNVFPHDPRAYTQGLVLADGVLLESTGRTGQSSLRRVELGTGKVLLKVDIPRPYFAEGLALLNGKLFQLTWEHGVGFIYDAATFAKLGEFKYSGEGWGLTTDGTSLILSDGSNRLKFFDPETFTLQKSINVLDKGRVIANLNELEYVKGEVYANIWHEERIARIDPNTGSVNGWIDLTGLSKLNDTTDEEAVLNGIAYDGAGDRLFVTGKLWPKLFEIRVKQD